MCLGGSDTFGAIDAILAYNMIILHRRKNWLKLYSDTVSKKDKDSVTLFEYYKQRIATRPSIQQAFQMTEDELLQLEAVV